MVPIEFRTKEKPLPTTSSPTDHFLSSLSRCDKCGKELKDEKDCCVYVDKDTFISHLICNACVPTVMKSSPLLIDSLEFYQKRFKIGFIHSIIEEYKNGAN